MRAIYEWGALLSATLATACLTFWGVSVSGVLASPTTGFDVFLAQGDGRYVVSEHGNAWVGFNLKRAADADRLRKRVRKENVAEWNGPGFLVFISDHSDGSWLVGGSLLIPMLASAIVATICFVAVHSPGRCAGRWVTIGNNHRTQTGCDSTATARFHSTAQSQT